MRDKYSSEVGCPLCQSSEIVDYHKDKKRTYLHCLRCKLVFVSSSHWLTNEEEKAVYDLHENDPEDKGYRQFLSRLTDPLLERLSGKCQGLDFGCGPGPALAYMLREQGHWVDLYDPFYFNNEAVLDKTYDFICATEVVEHLHHPKRELAMLISMLKPGGWLGVMTKIVLDQQAFRTWHYIQDPTHICFYSRETFQYIAELFAVDVMLIEKDVILLQKH